MKILYTSISTEDNKKYDDSEFYIVIINLLLFLTSVLSDIVRSWSLNYQSFDGSTL